MVTLHDPEAQAMHDRIHARLFGDLNAPEPAPRPSDAAWDLVLADMRDRDALGARKYGQRLTPGDGRNTLVDAYQEALDLVVYLRKELHERSLDADDADLIDEDPPLGDFHDQAQLAMIKLASRLGFEQPEATAIPLILAAVGERLKRYDRILDRWTKTSHRLASAREALAMDDIEGARRLLAEVP